MKAFNYFKQKHRLRFFRRVEVNGNWHRVVSGRDDPGSPILEFLWFITQGNVEFIPNRAAIVKVAGVKSTLGRFEERYFQR